MDRDRPCHQVAPLIGGIGGIEAGSAGGGRSVGSERVYAKHAKIVHCVTRGRSVCFYGEGNVFRPSRSRARRRRARRRRVLKILPKP